MKFIPELTGIRALAALMVFVAHASKDGLLPAFLGISYGMQGVFLFFTLSGFLMGQLYLERKLNKESLKAYLIARVARIFPLYLLILLIAFVISNYIYSDFHYDFRSPTLFFLGLFFINTPYELWTVPIEVQFYACFILFWFLYSREKRNKLTLILFPFFIFIPTLVLYKIMHKVPHIMPTFSLLFSFGVFLSILKNRGSLDLIKNKVPSFISWTFFFLFIVNLAGMRELLGVTEVRPWHNIYSIILLILFFVLVVSKPGDFVLLRIKPMLLIGEISYGFYLIHRPILKLFENYDYHPLLILFASLLTTIVLATLLFKFIETPTRELIKHKFSIKKQNQ